MYANILSGYPPADHLVRDYFTGVTSKEQAFQSASAFIEELFTLTSEVVPSFDKSLDQRLSIVLRQSDDPFAYEGWTVVGRVGHVKCQKPGVSRSGFVKTSILNGGSLKKCIERVRRCV